MTVTLSGQTWTATTPSTGAVIGISSPIPVLLGDRAYFSVGSATSSKVKWGRLIDSANRIVGMSDGVKVINGITVAEIPVTTFANTSTFTNCTVEFMVDLSSGTFTAANLLAEVNFLGTYFDGSTPNGGWLVGVTTVSDYRWAGSANNSVSIYAEDYQKTIGAVSTLFKSSLPITEESKYEISVYNGIRGM